MGVFSGMSLGNAVLIWLNLERTMAVGMGAAANGAGRQLWGAVATRQIRGGKDGFRGWWR